MFTEKLKERYAVNVKAVRNAIFNLRSMVGLQGEIHFAANASSIALSSILDYYGIHKPVDSNSTESMPDIERFLDRNDLMYLRMTLREQWWKSCSGPVLAMDHEGNFLAILPEFFGYRILDPRTCKKHRFTQKDADKLDQTAINIFPNLPKKSLTRKEFQRYCRKIMPKKGLLMILAFCILTTLLSMCIPIANKSIFSEVVPSGAAKGILPVCGFLLGTSISAILFQLCRNFSLVRLKDKYNSVLQSSLVNRLLYLPSSFFKKYSAGNMSMRILAANNVYQILTSQMLAGMAAAIFSIMYVLIAFIYAKSMIVVVSFTTISAILISISTYRFYLRKYRYAVNNSINAQDFAYSAILGIQKIKNGRAEQRAFEQWALRFSKSEIIDKYGKILSIGLTSISTFLAHLTAWKTQIAVSDYVAFMSAFGVMLSTICHGMHLISNMANISPYIDMLEPILQTEPENKIDYPLVEDISGSIDINHVSFRYSNESPMILDDISLFIPAGQNVAFVGKSGCGKSTLMRLLLGFEEPLSGSIFYGHYNISKVNLGSLRQFVGFCPQSMQIIPETISENIRFATVGCSDEDIWNAAKIACLDEDIRKMPKQMETVLGEGGSGLSGGQCQRLLIARAVLNNPRILFLDEATSALDNITQKKVIENLSNFGCTRISIAHRLSTVMNCDRIIVFDKGKIIEDGSPEELMEKKGFFYELSKRQM